jgi:hypothetical protein
MALTEDEVQKLEEEANLARRRNIAAANIADARGTAGMQRAYNQMRAESDMAAHERYMARRRAFAERNPLSVPGEERRRLQLQEDRGSLRAHEMAMLDKRNAGNLAVAKENRVAAREQGMEAANATAQANIKLGEINSGIKEKEFELARQRLAQEKELETLKGKNTIDAINAQNKGSESVEKIKGEWDVKKQSELNKGIMAQAETARISREAKLAAELQKAKMNNDTKEKISKEKSRVDIISETLKQSAAEGKDVMTTLMELEEKYKNDPVMLDQIDIRKENIAINQPAYPKPKEGELRQIRRPDGSKGWAVFVNNKWVQS